MKTYTAEDRTTIKKQYAPSPTTVARVLDLKHLFGENYKTVETHWFDTREDAIEYACEFGAEVNLPEHYGDMAFSANGNQIRLVTFL